MQFADFKASLAQAEPPDTLTDALRVLWLDAKGQFDAAHDVASNLPDPEGALLHAYLHRKEGDLDNAEYWYGRARAQAPTITLHAEWSELVTRFLV